MNATTYKFISPSEFSKVNETFLGCITILKVLFIIIAINHFSGSSNRCFGYNGSPLAGVLVLC